MIFYSKIYFPRFFPTTLEKAIQDKLDDTDTLNWELTRYKALLNLKKQASRMISSLEELKKVTEAQQIDSMDKLIQEVIKEAISNPSFDGSQHFNVLNNKFSLLKDEVEEHKNLEKCFSGCNVFANSIVTSAAALGVVLFGAAAVTGPLGIALLGIGMTLLSALVLSIATYSVYVDARFIGDKQLSEIDAGINFLTSYPNVELMLEKDVPSNTLCGI
ncbi:hypothetical protein [Legionella sp. PC997]|uniref:hypothetical protein n=1 Tax=Legionella sp. PC997 TaxID=2755562 RepID=UPI0015F96EA9|nr:hypothetical protein [Legionella sp. PC997]QMT61542.1 hypothetical protein HBNCFIEN_02946 [Legionella sp. PC997]